MRKSITVNIPEPCHEDWNKMTPKDQGRHCATCNKTVIDFTKQTDEQIIKTFESSRKLCGRFKTQQLNREIVLTRKSKNSYLSWAASGLFAFMAIGNQDANAQGTTKIVQTDSVNTPQIKGKIATSILKEKIIVGKVTTAGDGLPLPGASITILGTLKGTQTDFDGKYKLKAKVGDTLIFNYVGMKSIEIIVDNYNTIDASLEDDGSLEDVIVVAGMISYTPNYTYHCNIGEDYEPPLYASEVERKKANRNREYNQKWKERNRTRRTKWKNERITKREAIKNGEQKRTILGKFFYRIKSLFSKK